MHELARETLEKRTNDLIGEYDFEKRKKTHPEECICYQQNVKCHNLENLNCFFCLCPNYDMSIKEGGCKINSPNGKYIPTMKGKIFDCSACNFPHEKEDARNILLKVYTEN